MLKYAMLFSLSEYSSGIFTVIGSKIKRFYLFSYIIVYQRNKTLQHATKILCINCVMYFLRRFFPYRNYLLVTFCGTLSYKVR